MKFADPVDTRPLIDARNLSRSPSLRVLLFAHSRQCRSNALRRAS
ncbi:hypothetical protein LMG28614_03444 [Paraburkholderia ultramafica]|uniref:Uncharacterized protein n=1 Tax=Paraburkholderia ultramafica TaxID=1544867 RepID=A0A6S7CKM5_9BURK|nr:hypothetical protein LMG28614_03444 [Paraburkholderia ultramafica]